MQNQGMELPSPRELFHSIRMDRPLNNPGFQHLDLVELNRQLVLGRSTGPRSNSNNQNASVHGLSSDADTVRFDPSPAAQPMTAEAMERSRAELAPKIQSAVADTTHQCAICLDEVKFKAIVQPCFHQFCHICLFEWAKKKSICPCCRGKIGKLIYNIESDTVYDEVVMPMVPPNDGPISIQISVAPPLGPGVLDHSLVRPFWFTREFDPLLHAIGASSSNSESPENLRMIRVSLIQMMVQIHYKYPDLGYPTRRLTYDMFRSVLNFATPESRIPGYYRCYVYQHNLIPAPNDGNGGKARENYLEFLQNNPTMRHRLISYMKQEINILRRCFTFTLNDSNQLFEQLNNILMIFDLRSEQFKDKFRNLILTLTSLANAFPTYDVVNKMYDELVVFSTSKFSEHNDHVMHWVHMSRAEASQVASEGSRRNGPSANGENTPPASSSQQAQQQAPPPPSQPQQSQNLPQNGPLLSQDGEPMPEMTTTASQTNITALHLAGVDTRPSAGPSGSQAAPAPSQAPPPPPVIKSEPQSCGMPPSAATSVAAVAAASTAAPSTSAAPPAAPLRPRSSKLPIEVITISSDSSSYSDSSEVEWIPPVAVPVSLPPQPSSTTAPECKPGPNGLQNYDLNKAGPSGLQQNNIDTNNKPGPSSRSLQEQLNSQKPGPSGLQSSKAPLSAVSNKSKNGPHTRSSAECKKRKTMQNGRTHVPPYRAPTYSRRQIASMRRTIRNATNSEYFYRKLLAEVQKKCCNYDTVLDAPEFISYEPLFKDMYYTAKVYKTRHLTDTVHSLKSGKILSYTDFMELLSRVEKKRAESPNGRNILAGEQSSTESDDYGDDTATHIANYEACNRNLIAEEAVQHSVIPEKRIKISTSNTRMVLETIRKNKVRFVNHLYSDSDSP